MANRQVAIRIATEGKAEVKRDFREVADAGQQGFRAIGDAAERDAQRAQRAFERATAEIEAAQARQAKASAKLSAIAPQTSVQMRIGDTVGTGYSDYEGSAKRSAEAFRELIGEQERMEAKARAIKAALDPLAVATDRYNRELAELRALQASGHLTAEELAQSEIRLKAAFDQANAAAARGGVSAGSRAAGFRQIGQNIGDVAAQAATGTSALMIFSMQAGQFAQALELIGGTGKAGAFVRFIGGPWTQVIIAAVSLFALFGDEIFDAGEKTEVLTAKYGMNGDAARTLTQAIRDLTDAQDKNNLSKQDAIDRSIAYSAYLYKEAAATREATLAQLEKSKEMLAASTSRAMNPTGYEDALADLAAAGGYQKAVDELNRKIRQQTKDVADAQAAYRNAKADRAEFFATADVDAAARATAKYNDTVRALRQQFRNGDFGRGKEGEAELRRRIAEAQKLRDSEKDAAKDAAKAQREADKAQREADKSAREYQKSLKDLLGSYDPLAAAAREYADELERIAKLQVPAAKRDQYSAAAERAFRDKVIAADQAESDAVDAKIGAILSRPGGIADMIANDNERIDNRFSTELDRWAAAVEKKNALVTNSYLELRSAGEGFIDSVLDPANWNSWSDVGKTAINAIRNELLKLALINPLKNLLFGGSLPTLGGLFGGTTPASSVVPQSYGPVTFTASGSDYFSGGMTWLAENGPELVRLPRGAQVTPAAETRRLLAGNDRPAQILNFYANDAVLADTVKGWIAEGMEVAATRGAQGGATLAQMNATKFAQRTIRR